MNDRESQMMTGLMAIFEAETAERLAALESGLLALEKTTTVQDQAALLETIYREAHSLKGAARAVNRLDVEGVCQTLESMLADIKRGLVLLAPELFDTLHKTMNTLDKLLASTQTKLPEGFIEKIPPLGEDTAREKNSPSHGENRPPVEPRPPDTVRIRAEKLDTLLLRAEELLSAKLAASQCATELDELSRWTEASGKRWNRMEPAIRAAHREVARQDAGTANGDTPGHLARLLEFIQYLQPQNKTAAARITALTRTWAQDSRALGTMVDGLLEDTKKILMQSAALLLEILPKQGRELARNLGKEVDVVVQGAEVEIDRRILEEMKDPLLHLLRNCIDHGIELPADRERDGKSRCGTVTVSVNRLDDNRVEIVVADDGAGIDVADVKAAALRHRLLSPREEGALDDDLALRLIFESGLSTSTVLTDLSGRGLGLAIVREKVEKLGGQISVTTRPRQGTSFQIRLPMMLTTLSGIMVQVGGRPFIIPTVNLERVVRVRRREIKTMEGKATVLLEKQPVAFVSLQETLGLPLSDEEPDAAFVMAVILGLAGKHIAFGVDAVLEEREVLVKALGRQLVRVRHVAGATVLSTGQVVPILNVGDLFQSAVSQSINASPAASNGAAPARKKSILVAEDSITSRTLLVGILESAGYAVQSAVDGDDAFNLLRAQKFDLLVSDIKMPRLNGLDLTAKIRADFALANLPVVLVTARSSHADREQGMRVGANAYIDKSTFDPNNLLETVRGFL